MTKAILMVLLAVVSSCAAAGWVKVGGGGGEYNVYADAATIHKAGNTARMWNILDYKSVRVLDGKRFLSSMMQYEYDCKAERGRLLYSSIRSQNMGKGDAILTDLFPHEWRSLPHGSVVEELWNYACSTR